MEPAHPQAAAFWSAFGAEQAHLRHLIFSNNAMAAFGRIQKDHSACNCGRTPAARGNPQEGHAGVPAGAGGGRQESPPGLPAQIRAAREAQRLTWYAVAKLAGIPNPNTVRDIEYGRDAQLSNVQAVAKALGLRLELVEEAV